MPVVDTRQFKNLPKKNSRKSKFPIILAIILISAFIFLIRDNFLRPIEQDNSSNSIQDQVSVNADDNQQKTGVLKVFTGPEFKDLARAVKYPNTQLFPEPPEITGNKAADARIRQIAESRGFVLTSIPITSIVKLNEPMLDPQADDLLQPLSAQAWNELKAAAKRDGIPITLLSAYRSPKYQRDLFISRLFAKGTSVEKIAAGRGDAAIEATLTMTAPPGYSRHHTGYTIDLWCEDGSGAFVNSSCFRWIKADNYKVAKQTGWIPSYPDGVSLQGPEPEPWEYVWVSKDLVTE